MTAVSKAFGQINASIEKIRELMKECSSDELFDIEGALAELSVEAEELGDEKIEAEVSEQLKDLENLL